MYEYAGYPADEYAGYAADQHADRDRNPRAGETNPDQPERRIHHANADVQLENFVRHDEIPRVLEERME